MSVNLICPINDLGYGVASLNIFKALINDNIDIALFPLGQIQVNDEEDAHIIRNALIRSKYFDVNAPCVKIWHQNDMAQFVGKSMHIGFPFFELDEFNDHEKHHLNSLDKIFVASEWAKQVCENELQNKEIHVVPLGVNSDLFKPANTSEDNQNTIFFNCGKWEIRKGHDVLFDLFNKAFTKNDNVELWMMNHNPFISETEQKHWENLYKNSNLGDKIKILPRVNTHNEVYNIMSKVDVGIFPSRAEGWNLEILELMSCGKHIITTNYSAHTEFCNKENALLVDIDELETAYDGKWFLGSCGKWATISDRQEEQFVNHMRSIHQLKQNGQLKNNEAGITTSQKLTWKNTSTEMLKYV